MFLDGILGTSDCEGRIKHVILIDIRAEIVVRLTVVGRIIGKHLNGCWTYFALNLHLLVVFVGQQRKQSGLSGARWTHDC